VEHSKQEEFWMREEPRSGGENSYRFEFQSRQTPAKSNRQRRAQRQLVCEHM